MRRGLIAALALASALGVHAGEPDIRTQAEQTSRMFANCAGLWDFLGHVELADNKPATAEQMRNTGNGAQAAALYMLGAAHVLEGGEPRPYGHWLPMVQPHRESNAKRMLALVEQDSADVIEQEATLCRELLKEQDRILTRIRRDFADEAAP